MGSGEIQLKVISKMLVKLNTATPRLGEAQTKSQVAPAGAEEKVLIHLRTAAPFCG